MENSVPLSPEPQTGAAPLFAQAFAAFVQDLKRWFLPHLLGGVGVFLVMAYATSYAVFSSWVCPLKWVGIALVLLVYASVAFGYSLFTSGVLAIRLACTHWDHLIDQLLDLIQQKAAGQLADANVGLSKAQARTVVSGSVREVVASFRLQKDPVLVRALGLMMLGFLSVTLRTVLTAKVIKWSGRTIKLSKLFAGKATLVGAVFLNLHFFATLLLWLCYAAGAAVLILNICFIFLV